MHRFWLMMLVVSMIALTGCGFSEIKTEMEPTSSTEGSPTPAQMLSVSKAYPRHAVLVIPDFESNGCMGLVPCEIHVKVNEAVEVAFSYVVPNYCFLTYITPMCQPRIDIGLPSDGLRVGHSGMRSGHFMVTPQFSAKAPGEHYIDVQFSMTHRWFKSNSNGASMLKVIATE